MCAVSTIRAAGLATLQIGFDDVGAEAGKRQQPADISRIEAFRGGNFLERKGLADNHPLLDHLDEMRVPL